MLKLLLIRCCMRSVLLRFDLCRQLSSFIGVLFLFSQTVKADRVFIHFWIVYNGFNKRKLNKRTQRLETRQIWTFGSVWFSCPKVKICRAIRRCVRHSIHLEAENLNENRQFMRVSFRVHPLMSLTYLFFHVNNCPVNIFIKSIFL